MTRVFYYQNRENSLLEGQNHIFLPLLKNWGNLLSSLVLVFLFRHLCSNVFGMITWSLIENRMWYRRKDTLRSIHNKVRDIYSLIDCWKTIRFNQSTQAWIQTISKGREVPLKKEVQNKKITDFNLISDIDIRNFSASEKRRFKPLDPAPTLL